MINFIKKCPLCFAIIVTFILLNIFGGIAIYSDMVTLDISITHPLIASVFEYVSDMMNEDGTVTYDETPIGSVQSFAIETFITKAAQEESTETNPENTDGTDAAQDAKRHADVPNENIDIDDETLQSYYGKVIYTNRATGEVCSPYDDEMNVTASSTVYDYSAVDSDFFENSLFIGDSQISGLCRYTDLSVASYCFKDGLNVWGLNESGLLDKNFEHTTIDDALNEKTFDYVYIMLGINEAGYGTPLSFANQFREDVLYIRQKQPTAKIVILGIMGVTKTYSDNSNERDIDNLKTRNVYLSYLANGEDVFYLDVNEAICDSNGLLYDEYSTDGVHLKAQYYSLWADYICTHAFVD